jgi:ABC-type multidrug transport system fused ATPase/permease subunit
MNTSKHSGVAAVLSIIVDQPDHNQPLTGENSTGALTTRLEQDANAMSKATGIALGHKVQIAMTPLIGVLIGLIVAWQVGLVAMAVLPFMGKGTTQTIHLQYYSV